MEEEMVLRGAADMGRLPGVEINTVKPESKGRCRSLNHVECSGAHVYGGWWDRVLFLAEDAKARIKT